MNLFLVFGCRPSAGVKANTDMIKNILLAFIGSADRINCMTLIPWSLDFIDSSDAQFETASSSKIQTLQLFYKHNIVTHSIGLVLFHNETFSKGLKHSGKTVASSHQMLKKTLKLD